MEHVSFNTMIRKESFRVMLGENVPEHFMSYIQYWLRWDWRVYDIWTDWWYWAFYSDFCLGLGASEEEEVRTAFGDAPGKSSRTGYDDSIFLSTIVDNY